MEGNSHKIEIRNDNISFRCHDDESLLKGIEKQRVQAINIGCRGGGCGVCKIKIISGAFQAKKMSIKHVSKDQSAAGFALSCRIFPNSDMVIETVNDETSETMQ